MPQRQIIAMGGGGFWMEPDNPLLDRYIIESASKPNPTVCFLPTACGDADARIVQFYTAFNALPCRPTHLSLFRRPADLAAVIEASDVIYVGGGNTRFMLAIWKACGLDRLLREAWERGTLLCGLSAGAICWFEQGLTDSDGPLAPLDCLGFLPGSCSPHYDGEAERRPCFHRYISEGSLAPGIALDDSAAAHFIDDKLHQVVTSRPDARAFTVRCGEGTIQEEPLPVRFFGQTPPIS